MLYCLSHTSRDFFILGGQGETGVSTQDLMLASQVLYHLSQNRVLQTILPGLASNSIPPDLCLPSS
jgi:hypothetical protein